MSKKIISLFLTVILAVSMFAVAAVSVSAEVDEQGRYIPSEGVDTYKYYFYMPSDWYNDCASQAGVYWWIGSDSPSAWPGYNAYEADAEGIYYSSVPVDATTIIWNNAFDGGEDTTSPDYAKAIQTSDVSSQFYSLGDSDVYDSEFFAEMENYYNNDKSALGNYADNFFYDEEFGLGFSFNYNNMIYVINPDMISENPLNGKIVCGGEWYFYYGNGEYGTYPTRDEALQKGKLFSSDYQPSKEEPSTESTTVYTEPSETASSTDSTAATDASEDAGNSELYLTVNATSNYFPEATAEYNQDTNEVTVTYLMKSTKNVLDTQWNLYYDSSVLSVSDKNTADTICPTIGSYGVFNLGIDGVVKYNATNLKLFDFTSSEQIYVSIIFDVKDLSAKAPVTTTVDLDVNVLRVSKINQETFMSDENEEVMLCNFSEVLDNEMTNTVKVERRTELTESTYVETSTGETTVTTETTVEPEPTVPYLTVNATSNYFPMATAQYKKSTNEVVVTYWMKSDMNVLDLQWYLTYDSEVLTLSDKNSIDSVCPTIGDKAVINMGLKNMIKYNATNLNLFDFTTEETPFAQIVFDVNDLTGKELSETTVNLTVEVLRVSEIDPETLRSDPDKEIILVNDSEVITDSSVDLAGVQLRTSLTPSSFVAPTTVATTTEEPTTVEPTTTLPTEATTEPTEAPTTVSPTEVTTVEPTETTQSTSAESTSTVSSSTASPATDPTSATGQATSDTTANTNTNAPQTGDTSLAVIILSILIGATCVMFVLRKREMM